MRASGFIDDYLIRIHTAQRVQRAIGDPAGVVAVYDQLISEMLNTFECASASERQSIRLGMSRDGSGLLLGAAEGSATWAVREQNPQRLRIGLTALLVENLKEDSRETLMALTLLYNAARKLSADLQALYNDVRHLGEPQALDLFDAYFAQGGKSLSDMGYYESVNDAGDFCYLRSW